MTFNSRFISGVEKRLPVMMDVRLLLSDNTAQAKAYVENISGHGARVYAASPR
jgi:hypothetical protein